ncbi:MAG: hypothetical protein OXH59_01480 [Rhodospirillaceae bacterium]|nr:hypothetical protein [Rhodospirillaceae bacterium]
MISKRRLCAVVFNNPFGSFHNTVAEAKEEREQLDRLLTISTPRERLLVAGIALLTVILAAWLFFGSIVARTVTLEGVLVPPAQTQSGSENSGSQKSVQAIVWIERGAAPQIGAGMPAAIELETADGDAETFDGEIAAISAVRSSRVLEALGPAAPVSAHRIVVSLGESLDVASLADRKCRIVVELGRQSPAALLRTRRP